VCSRCRSSLPQGPLHSRCIRRRPPASAICSYWSSTGSTRSDSHWAAEFRRQRTYRLEQSATSTTFARSVAEHLQADTEDASLLIRSATLSRFKRDFAAAYKSADLLTYLLTYMGVKLKTKTSRFVGWYLATMLFMMNWTVTPAGSIVTSAGFSTGWSDDIVDSEDGWQFTSNLQCPSECVWWWQAEIAWDEPRPQRPAVKLPRRRRH